MNWTAVTPETMPSEGEDVLIVVISASGQRVVLPTSARVSNGKWELLVDPGSWGYIDASGLSITHWMPYPEPPADVL